MDFNEQKNLSLLLISEVDANVELGLELLKNNETYIPTFQKELVLISQLHTLKNLSKEAEDLLLKYSSKKDYEVIKTAFGLFLSNLYYGKEYALKSVPKHEAIREIYMPFIEQNSNYALRYYQVGEVLSRIEELKEFAEIYLKICLQANPAHKDCLYALAYFISNDENRADEALGLYNKLLEYDPKSCAAWNNLAVIHEKNYRYLDAYKHYSNAIQFDTYNKALYKKNLASLCVHFLPEKKYQEEAKQLMLDVIKIEPRNSSSWITYGNYFWLCEQDYEATEKAYLEGLKLNSKSSDLLGNLGELYVDIFKDYEKGLYYYNKTLRQDCSIYQYCNIFAFFVNQLENYTRGKKLFRLLREKKPEILLKKPPYLTDVQYANFNKAHQQLRIKFPKSAL